MSLIGLVLTIAIIGFVVWLILQVPMPEPFPRIIIGVVILFAVLFALQQFGLLGSLNLRLR